MLLPTRRYSMDESSKFGVCEEGRKRTECASGQAFERYWAKYKSLKSKKFAQKFDWL